MQEQIQNVFSTKRTQNGTIIVQLNGKYQLKQGDEFYELIEFIVPDINTKNNKIVFDDELDINFYSSIQFKLGKCKMEQQKCTICLDQFEIKDIEKQLNQQSGQDVYALPCSHIYHKECLLNMIGKNKWVKCPVCSTIYGKMIGDMPEGTMKVNIDAKTICQGHPAGAIVIHYNFPGCKRNNINIPGTQRNGYLPNTPEGKQVLQLLKQCFDRKLTFTVGRSVTTGMDNQIVWNGIHHKTALNGGSANFGYPDPTYLKRVKQQLAAKGIVPKKPHHHHHK